MLAAAIVIVALGARVVFGALVVIRVLVSLAAIRVLGVACQDIRLVA